MVREARALLAAPARIVPSLNDLVWSPSGGLLLVEELLSGTTLTDRAVTAAPSPTSPPGIPRAGVPLLACRIAAVLGELHRARSIHGDIKPENIWLEDGPDGAGRVLLLDLGFSRMADPARDPVEEARSLGGTPLFLAPEIVLGWATDARSDLFSLGMTLRLSFPGLDSDPAWESVLERLTQRSPSKRYPDVPAFLEDMTARFGTTLGSVSPPRFGAGPLRGRDAALAEAREKLGHAPLVLVQGTPGCGITRFLMECTLERAEARGPALSACDLGFLAPDHGTALLEHGKAIPDHCAALLDYVDRRLLSGDNLLVGLPDPSPALRWPGLPLAEEVRSRILAWAGERVLLPALTADDLGEIAASSLGSAGAEIAPLGRALALGSEGDLRAAAAAFDRAVTEAGHADGLTWGLSWPGCEPGLRRFREEHSPLLRPDSIPSEHLAPLALLARAGERVPRPLAFRMLERYLPGSGLERLVDAGLLVEEREASAGREASAPDGAGSFGALVRFPSRRLHALLERLPWRRPGGLLAEVPCRGEAGPEEELDRWLHDNLSPEPEQTEEVLRALHRAHRLAARGDTLAAESEADLLRRALVCSFESSQWEALLVLLSYPGDPPERWTVDGGADRAATLHRILGPAWPVPRLLLLLGSALHGQDQDEAGWAILEHSGGMGGRWAAESLARLVGLERQFGKMPEYRAHLAVLERLESRGDGPAPGVVDLERARAARMDGDLKEAEALGRRAASALAGTRTSLEVGSLMFLAQICLPARSGEGITLMRRACEVATQPEIRALSALALAQMHEINGDISGFVGAIERAHQSAAVVPNRLLDVAVRQQRAWAWALSDRIGDAAREAATLLEDSRVQAQRPRRAMAHLFAGFAALCSGNLRQALPETARAWETLGEGGSPKLRAAFLRHLVDTILDLGGWRALQEYRESVAFKVSSDPSTVLTEARWRALKAQAAGDWEEAARILLDLLPDARAHTDLLDSARFLHHAGHAVLGPGSSAEAPRDIETACALFGEALERYGPAGYGYFRCGTLLGSARALRSAGRLEEAREACEQAIARARRIGARGVLAEGLQLRVALRVG